MRTVSNYGNSAVVIEPWEKEMNEDILRQLVEQIGQLKREVTHLGRELMSRTESHCQLRVLPYSSHDNDVEVQHAGFNKEIQDALRQNNVLMVSQVLNLGTRWLDNAPRIGPAMTEKIKAHLFDNMGVGLPD